MKIVVFFNVKKGALNEKDGWLNESTHLRTAIQFANSC
jgi:hypothetical protein